MSRADRIMGYLVIAGWIALSIAVAASGAIPYDTSSYLIAADLFWNQDLNPYLFDHLVAAPLWDDHPYVYHPGTLVLLYPMAALPTWAVVLGVTLLRGAATIGICRWLVGRYELAVSWPMTPPGYGRQSA